MTKEDATQFLMGFVLGATMNKALVSHYDRQGLLLKRVTTKGLEMLTDRQAAQIGASASCAMSAAARRGLDILLDRQAGFFNALERIIREEIESSGFMGEAN